MQSESFQQGFSHVQRKLMHKSLFYIKSNLNSTIMAKSLKIIKPYTGILMLIVLSSLDSRQPVVSLFNNIT